VVTSRGRKVAAPPAAGAVGLPSHAVSPLRAVTSRLLLAFGLLVLCTLIVYLGRDGYRDNAHPGQPLSLLASVYYATITLSTTGFGDIVPVTAAARLVNIVLIFPIRLVFLVVLVGTTLAVLTQRTRTDWRIAQWRSKVTGHTVVVGYGTKGRSAIAALRESGVPGASIVVIDTAAEAVAEASAAGLVTVTGDGTRRDVLAQAEAARAAQVIIAVHRDDTAVLIALTARELCPGGVIVAAVRDRENEGLLRQSGANQVVVSSDAAGRLLGISTIRPSAARVIADLLDSGCGLDLDERPVAEAEVGRPAREAAGAVIAVHRGARLLAADDPEAARLQAGDRLILLATAPSGSAPSSLGS
jgi:voltage-gated potassium channel